MKVAATASNSQGCRHAALQYLWLSVSLTARATTMGCHQPVAAFISVSLSCLNMIMTNIPA